jgi:hypothetical protein
MSAELENLRSERDRINRRIADLENAERDAKSIEFVRVNQITADDVQSSDDDGVPWATSCYEFGRWLSQAGCRKRYAEWNGQLCYAADLMAGFFRPTVGLAEHVPGFTR